VFGDGTTRLPPSSPKWTLFGGSSSNISDTTKEDEREQQQHRQRGSSSRRKKLSSSCIVDIPVAKRDGIKHAFTAEALRSIGSDEVDRLQQLIDAGMPPDTTEIGNKNLYQWSMDMDAMSTIITTTHQ
jgi:hypothetical protein